MRLAIDALSFTPGRTLGAQTYLLSLLSALEANLEKHQISVVCTSRSAPVLREVAPRLNYFSVNMPHFRAARYICRHLFGGRIIDRLGGQRHDRCAFSHLFTMTIESSDNPVDTI